MKYTLRIEGENGRIDITGEDIIRKVDIKIFQIDKSASDRSDQLFNSLIIQGELKDKSQKETKELFDWAMKTDKQTVYKTVSLQAYDGDELIRDYYLKNMFCTSYEEIFNEYHDEKAESGKSIGTFILELKQRKGFIDTIVVDC